ncbi:MAG: hypothetical protein EOP09_12530 [Proteobacteria bacterium]|nr:MAG: hypothetical protein EOP09_12530 [Pseudomonadota bacterium]
MPPSIPEFDHNSVLPPHTGDPAQGSTEMSPYRCTTVELCQRFGTSPERRAILRKYLEFRRRLREAGISNGFQWLDGSFVEDIEAQENRPPKDLDLVTFFWGYDLDQVAQAKIAFPAFGGRKIAKKDYFLDHFSVDADVHPLITIEFTRYYGLLFSHNREGVWKGMLRIDLHTESDDVVALDSLAK